MNPQPTDNWPKKGAKDFMAVLLGGSHLYGMNGPDSDVDYRGIYLSNNLPAVMGFAKDDTLAETKEEGDDYVYFELCRFLELLRKTNSNSMEILFAPDDAFFYCDHQFNLLRQRHAGELVDSKRLLESTKGYVLSESRLALGQRTGKLGGKRKVALDQYGFSPKNACQILRIVAATKHFLATGVYPIKMRDYYPDVWKLCMEIKTAPQKFSVDNIQQLVQSSDEEIQQAKDQVALTFNLDLAAEFAFKQYKTKFSKP